jgi:hypothetical protein
MYRRRRTVLLGLALVLLLAVGVGVGVAVLWPRPSNAERAADMIEVGMTLGQVQEVIGNPGASSLERVLAGKRVFTSNSWFTFSDGSTVVVAYRFDGAIDQSVVVHFVSVPPRPLDRLRRTLAHLFPPLGK